MKKKWIYLPITLLTAIALHGFNMAEKFLRLFHKEADDFELELLRHMGFAHYAIYQVEETNGTDTIKES